MKILKLAFVYYVFFMALIITQGFKAHEQSQNSSSKSTFVYEAF